MIIGLTGPAQSGKDTAGLCLVHKWEAFPIAFADPIRDMIEVGLGLDVDAIYDRGKKEESTVYGGKSLRYLLQTLGTEWGRNLIDTDIWLTRAQVTYWKLVASHGHKQWLTAVVTDVRFPNEAAWVRQNGSLWHMRREGLEVVGAEGHASEGGIEVLPEDIVIHNNGGLRDLWEMVDGHAEQTIGRTN